MGSAARAKVPSPATNCLGADNVENPPEKLRYLKLQNQRVVSFTTS